MEKIGSHHIWAEKDDIAKTVIITGDPLRAKLIANKYFKNPKLISNIRNINIWTGYFNNNKITIMGHGMGLSSVAIYAHELFEIFGVDRVLRVGSAATYSKDINQGDVVIGNKYYTHSVIGEGYGYDSNSVDASKELLDLFEKPFTSDESFKSHTGGVFSSLWFYAPTMSGEGIKENSEIEKYVNDGSIIAKEMEGYVLQVIANYFKKQAITILIIIDNLATKTYSDPNNKIDVSFAFEKVLNNLF